MAFRPIQSDQQASVPLTGRIELNAPGFVPLDELAASRVRPALTLEQVLAEQRAGTFPQQSQPLAAFARGALESALAGTTEASGSLAGANPKFDPNSPQFTNPMMSYAGEMVGNLVPLGRAKQALTGIKNLVREGARLGGIYGAGQGVSEVAASEDPSLTGALQSGAIEAAKGTALGATIPFVAGRAIKLNATKQNILDDLSKLSTGEEGKMQRSVTGGYVQAADKVTPFLKKGDGVTQFIDATDKALEKEANTFRPIIEKAPPTSINPDSIYALADAELAKLIPNAETRNELLLNSGDFLSDLTKIDPKNLLQYAAKANREIGRIYKNPSSPITADGLAAKEAVRDAYASTIRKVLEDAGQDPSVYSGYGAIKEMGSNIGKNYLIETYKGSAQEGKTFAQNFLSGLESKGTGLNIGRAIESTLAPGREVERLDSQINGLIDNFIGYGREKTNKSRAEKLDSALKFLNQINKNQAEPLQTPGAISDLISQVISEQQN